ncbi:hypothetical protein GIB67_023909, partial [Kingdonia uniflora]
MVFLPEVLYSNRFLFYSNTFISFLPEVFYSNKFYFIRIDLWYLCLRFIIRIDFCSIRIHLF